MRFATILLATLATCACSQTVTKSTAAETQATESTGTPPGRGGPPPAPASGQPAQFAYSPQAPNWQVRAIKLADNRWRLELRMRRWHTGGDGEAELLFQDQARELADRQGYRHYIVRSWVQGIESTEPIAQRWARGEIELTEAVPPMPLDKP